MTVRQQQLLLEYLGYDTGGIDGIPGPNTERATTAFQKDYGLEADGICGPATEAKIKSVICTGDAPACQPQDGSGYIADASVYLMPDGCYHIPRGVDVQLTKNFWAHEIHCQGVDCCAESVINKRIMDLAQEIRDDIGEPLEIATAGGSGYRCPVHNAETQGASPTSLHTISDAVDLHYRDPAKLKAATLRHLHDGEVGLYSWGCHVGRWDRGYISQFNG